LLNFDVVKKALPHSIEYDRAEYGQSYY